MPAIHEKRLYAPEAVNPGNDVAELLDTANKARNLAQVSYKTAFPDFSRAVTLTKNTIYHVNSPGWIFRAPNGTLSSSGINGVIIQDQSYLVDVFPIAFKEMFANGSLNSPTGKNIFYAAPNAKAVTTGGTADVNDSYGVLFFPKRFEDDFTQTNRLVYVTYSTRGSYSGGQACQIIPVLPSNPQNENEHYEDAITYVAATKKGTSVKDGVHTSSLMVETRGMYIMHCTSSEVNDVLTFVPAKCARSFSQYVTMVRQSKSDCNLDMYACETLGKVKSYAITNRGSAGTESMCSAGGATAGKYANLTIYCPGADNRAVTYALPTDNGSGSGAIVYGHGHEYSFCGCWQNIFLGGSPDIEGRTSSFKAYSFGTLDTIPIPGKTENKLGKGGDSAPFPSSAKKKWSSISFNELFELNKTSSLQTFPVN